MKKLNYELMMMCRRNRDSAHGTQKDRHNALQLMATQLQTLGFQTGSLSAGDLKGRHINRLTALWREQGIATGTQKNRMSALRWWAEKTGNPGVVKTNGDYGIGRRQMVSGESKALSLAGVDTAALSPHVGLSVQLQEAFGLRREEAMKFQVAYALRGSDPRNATDIALKASWTKGGRARVIPVTSDAQRRLLAAVKALTGSDSLIPASRSYREHLREFERETHAAGIGHTHGLRHHYAQQRYQALTGRAAPALGGPSRKAMTAAQRLADDNVRRVISEEMGHSRVSITAVYLGN